MTPVMFAVHEGLPNIDRAAATERATSCRWPVSGPRSGILFCGERIAPGSRYCTRHRMVATVAPGVEMRIGGSRRTNALGGFSRTRTGHEPRLIKPYFNKPLI